MTYVKTVKQGVRMASVCARIHIMTWPTNVVNDILMIVNHKKQNYIIIYISLQLHHIDFSILTNCFISYFYYITFVYVKQRTKEF